MLSAADACTGCKTEGPCESAVYMVVKSIIVAFLNSYERTVSSRCLSVRMYNCKGASLDLQKCNVCRRARVCDQ